MKYKEIYEDAKKKLNKDQIINAVIIQKRVLRYENQARNMSKLSTVSGIRAERKKVFKFLNEKLPKLKSENVFNIHSTPSRSLPCRLLVEHK